MKYIFVKNSLQRMIRPLCLKSPLDQHRHDEEMISPSARNRADSLVFSVTSQKYHSPKDTMLISKQHEVSKQIQTLQLKLQNLESRVQRIDSEGGTQSLNPLVMRPNPKVHPSNLFIEVQKEHIYHNYDKENMHSNKIGKIVKKERDCSQSSKTHGSCRRKNRNQTFGTHHSRQSRNSLISEDTQLFSKMKELTVLKKEVTVMRNSVEKSQRSRSNISQRLSASKDLIKSLKKDERKQHIKLQKLQKDLKKSQTIRQKQKAIISKQAQQLSYYRELFKASKPR